MPRVAPNALVKCQELTPTTLRRPLRQKNHEGRAKLRNRSCCPDSPTYRDAKTYQIRPRNKEIIFRLPNNEWLASSKDNKILNYVTLIHCIVSKGVVDDVSHAWTSCDTHRAWSSYLNGERSHLLPALSLVKERKDIVRPDVAIGVVFIVNIFGPIAGCST